jgi:hypothetical protein
MKSANTANPMNALALRIENASGSLVISSAVNGIAYPLNWVPNWDIVSEVQSLRKLG